MINRYEQKPLGAEPWATLKKTSKKAGEKQNKIIKKESSVVFNQMCINNMRVHVGVCKLHIITNVFDI